ncbi:response regulator transcription factor [Microbacterium dauci]|uniref:Response regulator n=1 Tax=Microbacterium dauci TaxID=3048008 RepID=A0ABT6ZE49_9MICO|nr:response regulator [Microbacterium sp. LX3-4]MDJ1114441.1 response regulator [Microbacterium sp. LX3-4]
MANVLVVEDDTDVASLLRHVLVGVGHEVEVAHDGGAGLAAAYAHHPDLVILDWMMPIKTGIEVCAALRADPDFERTRIMMITARSSPQDLARAEAAGADDYLVKPFMPRDLRARVQSLFDRD